MAADITIDTITGSTSRVSKCFNYFRIAIDSGDTGAHGLTDAQLMSAIWADFELFYKRRATKAWGLQGSGCDLININDCIDNDMPADY